MPYTHPRAGVPCLNCSWLSGRAYDMVSEEVRQMQPHRFKDLREGLAGKERCSAPRRGRQVRVEQQYLPFTSNSQSDSIKTFFPLWQGFSGGGCVFAVMNGTLFL